MDKFNCQVINWGLVPVKYLSLSGGLAISKELHASQRLGPKVVAVESSPAQNDRERAFLELI